MKRAVQTAVMAVSATALVLGGTTAADAKARTFKNCTEMHKVYRHGVGKPGARDSTSGKP